MYVSARARPFPPEGNGNPGNQSTWCIRGGVRWILLTVKYLESRIIIRLKAPQICGSGEGPKRKILGLKGLWGCSVR